MVNLSPELNAGKRFIRGVPKEKGGTGYSPAAMNIGRRSRKSPKPKSLSAELIGGEDSIHCKIACNVARGRSNSREHSQIDIR